MIDTDSRLRECLAELEQVVTDIRKAKGDPETQHSMEDVLHCGALEAIRNFAADPLIRQIAETALTTKDDPFPRWCA